MVAELVVTTTEPGSLRVAGIWMEELAQRLQQLETPVGQQCAVIEHLMRQQTTIDAKRAARTPVNHPRCDSALRRLMKNSTWNS